MDIDGAGLDLLADDTGLEEIVGGAGDSGLDDGGGVIDETEVDEIPAEGSGDELPIGDDGSGGVTTGDEFDGGIVEDELPVEEAVDGSDDGTWIDLEWVDPGGEIPIGEDDVVIIDEAGVEDGGTGGGEVLDDGGGAVDKIGDDTLDFGIGIYFFRGDGQLETGDGGGANGAFLYCAAALDGPAAGDTFFGLDDGPAEPEAGAGAEMAVEQAFVAPDCRGFAGGDDVGAPDSAADGLRQLNTAHDIAAGMMILVQGTLAANAVSIDFFV